MFEPKHVWVLVDAPRRAGLLLEWRRNDHGTWDGRVIYPTRTPRGWATIEEWVPGSMLVPRELNVGDGV